MSKNTILAERLETRLALCVTVAVDGDTLIINGNQDSQIVSIDDLKSEIDDTTVVHVDANGDGDLDDPEDVNEVFTGIRNFKIRLFGGDDELNFHISGYLDVEKTLLVNMGAGQDHFSFGFGLSEQLRNSTLTVDAKTGVGDDLVGIGMNDVRNDSLLQLNLDTGAGKDEVRSSYFGDIGNASNDSTLIVRTNLGSGDDSLRIDLDYESFDILHSGSLALFDTRGGSGNDSILVRAVNVEFGDTAQIQGQLSLLLNGQAGDDQIEVNMPPLAVQDGVIKVRALGAAGRDSLSVTLAADAVSTGGTLDVALLGGAQNDILFADVNDNSGQLDFGPSDAVRVDGGPGKDGCTTQGNAPFDIISC